MFSSSSSAAPFPLPWRFLARFLRPLVGPLFPPFLLRRGSLLLRPFPSFFRKTLVSSGVSSSTIASEVLLPPFLFLFLFLFLSLLLRFCLRSLSFCSNLVRPSRRPSTEQEVSSPRQTGSGGSGSFSRSQKSGAGPLSSSEEQQPQFTTLSSSKRLSRSKGSTQIVRKVGSFASLPFPLLPPLP